MEQINLIVAQNLKKYRKQNGLTQEDFAQKLGVTPQAVSKWENGKTSPDILLLPTIADVFACSIDELFSYLPKVRREKINVLPGDDVPDGMKEYLRQQITWQLDHEGSTNAILEIISENISGDFELTDENIERLLDAYRELYRGMRNISKA